jgi:signal peptidase I
MTLQWFLSKTVRQATAMRHHVQKIFDHQRDILSPPAIEKVTAAIGELKRTVSETTETKVIENQMEKLELAANQWLKPYPNAAWRENFEVLLVALAVAMGIRTFFLQPFKIPTGSMQPTLYGVTSEPDFSRGLPQSDKPIEIPAGWQRVRDWFAGISYLEIKASTDGRIERVSPPFKLLIFSLWQTLQVAGRTEWIFLPPDYGSSSLEQRAGLDTRPFKAGEDVVRMKVATGDHLFVDRLTYNFRPPKRGEIIVFETKGISGLPQGDFYIKRLVALGGERVQVGNDRHLIINGERLDSSTPHFEKVYSFNATEPPRSSHYSGHVNDKVLHEFYPRWLGPSLAPLFPEQSVSFELQPNHYMVMGDNTMDSSDSRVWGEFSASKVIGRSFFVYWPITDRFGWGYHR